MFEHKTGHDVGQGDFRNVKDKMRELCELTKDDIRPEVRFSVTYIGRQLTIFVTSYLTQNANQKQLLFLQ